MTLASEPPQPVAGMEQRPHNTRWVDGVFAFALLCWTLALAGSLVWNIQNSERFVMDTAYAEARAVRAKDMVFRRWGLRHGGVYVRVTDKEQPSPTLANVPGRDVVTTDGVELTLRAPATMVREMMDTAAEVTGVRARIIGLRALNPSNLPDPWERAQLESFTRREKKEVWEVADIDGKPYLRHLQAWDMEPGCVKCHAILGYKAGDMRGATGVSVPLLPYYAQIETLRKDLFKTHAIIWLLGSIGIAGPAARHVRERANARAAKRHYGCMPASSNTAARQS